MYKYSASFLISFYITYFVIRVLQFLWTTYRSPDTTRGSPLTCGQQCAGTSSKDNKDRIWTKDNETHSSYISCKNSLLEKNPKAKSGIEVGTSCSVGNEVATELNGRTVNIIAANVLNINFISCYIIILKHE